MSKWNNQKTEELLRAILALKNAAEARKFLRDLLTEQELIEFGNRFRAANLLAQGVSYARIEEATGLSSTTIARISRWLKQGRGGYKLMIERLQRQHKSSHSGKEAVG